MEVPKGEEGVIALLKQSVIRTSSMVTSPLPIRLPIKSTSKNNLLLNPPQLRRLRIARRGVGQRFNEAHRKKNVV